MARLPKEKPRIRRFRPATAMEHGVAGARKEHVQHRHAVHQRAQLRRAPRGLARQLPQYPAHLDAVEVLLLHDCVVFFHDLHRLDKYR